MDAFLLSSILGEINAPEMEPDVQKQKVGVWGWWGVVGVLFM